MTSEHVSNGDNFENAKREFSFRVAILDKDSKVFIEPYLIESFEITSKDSIRIGCYSPWSEKIFEKLDFATGNQFKIEYSYVSPSATTFSVDKIDVKNYLTFFDFYTFKTSYLSDLATIFYLNFNIA